MGALNLLGYQPPIPCEARRAIIELREQMGRAEYVNHVWRQRWAERKAATPHQCRTKARKAWPYVREENRPVAGVVKMVRKKLVAPSW